MKPTTVRLLERLAGGPFGREDLSGRMEKNALTKLLEHELVAKSTDGRLLVLTEAGRKRLAQEQALAEAGRNGSKPAPKRQAKKVEARPPAPLPTNGTGWLAVAVPAPAAAPARADGPGYREELAGALDREVLLAALCARELRKNA
jgi:hypothetical protein